MSMKKGTKWLISFLIIFAVLLLYASSKSSLLKSEGGNFKNTKEGFQLKQQDKITQQLSNSHKNIAAISLHFNSEVKQAHFSGELKLITKGETENINLTSDMFKEDGELYIPLSKNIQKKSTDLKIVIENIKFDENKGIYITTAFPIEDKMIDVNGEMKENKVVAVDYHLSSLPYWKLGVLLVLSGLVALLLVWAGKKIVVEYVLIATIFGSFFAVYTPIHQTSDEWVHFLKSQDVAQGNFITPKHEGNVGYFVSQKILDTYLHPVPRNEKINPDVVDYVKQFSIRPDMKNQQLFESQATTAVYTVIPYIPQAIGIKLAMIADTNIWTANILGRLVNLLAFVMMSAYALYKMPIMRRTFMFFMLAPIIMFHAASLSADAVLMGSSFIFIALVMRLWFNEDFKKSEFVAMAVSGIVMTLCKFTYWPLLLLMLCTRVSKYGMKKNYWLFNIGITGAAGLLVAGWNIFVMKYVGDGLNSGNVSATGQISYMLNHPLEALKVFIRSFDHGLDEWFEMYNTFGFLSTPLKGILYLYPIVFVLIAIMDQKEGIPKLDWMKKWGLRFCSISVILLVMLSIYMTWTTVGFPYVVGIQGRYFIPIIPLILLLIQQHFKIKVEKPNIDIFASKAATLFLTYAFVFWFVKIF
ncbi:DUF2142 domain-containing protein [Bacillus wiedmannii]|uniref:DUF2142 domain-containing protein n=1 Tax=Bacillus TaxID=1386 RepID=UPI0007DB0327|nr:DUF2142 domain-containing protein [Bacillus wiedmannii]OAK36707.1 hypothetical protein A6286_10735 [Bacillus wiedmannii]PEI72154.1 DUF2142 domain-containing protein [Bacillus wiedmannii]PEJ45745.1 DUF2142 domain-containing protein [Bacillus wiedmannii]PEM10668.1 DUF2142 domain-containing protein [Bacillus wiedmannii]PGB71499.1 DUF2142 domain-containing protein [Bacillus wiedmannii]